MIKVGLKNNANFLFNEMRGDTQGGVEGLPFWRSIVYLTSKQFEVFKRLIVLFKGNLGKSLTVSTREEVDYEVYFIKEE